MTANERILSSALDHALHQLALYVGPQDTATLALLRDYRRLLRQVKKNRRVSNRLESRTSPFVGQKGIMSAVQ